MKKIATVFTGSKVILNAFISQSETWLNYLPPCAPCGTKNKGGGVILSGISSFCRMLGVACALMLAGCGNFTTHDVKIQNNSSYTVTFQLERYGSTVYKLASTESVTLDIYNDPVLVFIGHPRVAYTSHTSVNIYDIDGYEITIQNREQCAVTVREENYRLGAESDDEGIIIPASYNEIVKNNIGEVVDVNTVWTNVSTKLYTDKPKFQVTDGDGKNYDYNLQKTVSDGKNSYTLIVF